VTAPPAWVECESSRHALELHGRHRNLAVARMRRSTWRLNEVEAE